MARLLGRQGRVANEARCNLGPALRLATTPRPLSVPCLPPLISAGEIARSEPFGVAPTGDDAIGIELWLTTRMRNRSTWKSTAPSCGRACSDVLAAIAQHACLISSALPCSEYVLPAAKDHVRVSIFP